MITVTGGKWTTYRKMAEEAVDTALATGRLPLNTGPCVTAHTRLRGAQGFKPTLHAEVRALVYVDRLSSQAHVHNTIMNFHILHGLSGLGQRVISFHSLCAVVTTVPNAHVWISSRYFF